MQCFKVTAQDDYFLQITLLLRPEVFFFFFWERAIKFNLLYNLPLVKMFIIWSEDLWPLSCLQLFPASLSLCSQRCLAFSPSSSPFLIGPSDPAHPKTRLFPLVCLQRRCLHQTRGRGGSWMAPASFDSLNGEADQNGRDSARPRRATSHQHIQGQTGLTTQSNEAPSLRKGLRC